MYEIKNSLSKIHHLQGCMSNVGLSQHMQKIPSLSEFELNWSLRLREKYERKKHPGHTIEKEVVCFQLLDFRTSKSISEVKKSYLNILVENYFLLKNHITSVGAISHNVLYYSSSPLLVTR